MRVLVTGGAGFIGSNLIDVLLKKNYYVSCIDKLTTGSIKNIEHNFANTNFSFIQGDITTDKEILNNLIKECDIVYHLAAAVGVKYIVDDPLSCMITNVSGTENIFYYAYRYWKKVVLASTSEVYGKSTEVPLNENCDRILGPTSINRWSYSASKVIDEHIAFAYAQKGLPVVILRFFNAYGPRINEEAYGTVVAAFIKQALANKTITVHGDGKQTRCFTFIEDTLKGIISAGETKSAEGKVFNIGNNKETSILTLAKLVKKLTKSKSEIKLIPYSDFYGQSYEDTLRRVPAIKLAQEILKFNPQIKLEEGLKKTIKWWKENYKS